MSEKLEVLSATECAKLRIFPRAIKLHNLRELHLSGCSSLKFFPEILLKMEYIKLLNLSNTNLELPFSIRNLTELLSLEMDNCGRIRLPSNIGLLPKLESIGIQSCGELQLSKLDERQEEFNPMDYSKVDILLRESNISDETLPICLALFANVEYLDLSGNNFTILPACIKECYHLRDLRLADCERLKDIRGIPPNIKVLYAINCTSLSLESTSILLDQKLHEVGHKRFLVPGASIPKWCDHYNSGLSIAFWFRNNVPRICLYFVVTSQAEPYFDLYLSVNGKYRRKINPLAELEGWNPLLDHILCVNEGSIFRSPELNKVLLQSERNSIEISMYLNGFRSVKEIGMNIMNQGNKRKKLDALNWDPSFGVSISYEEEKLEGGIHALRSINTEFDSYWKQHVKDEFTKSNANPNRDVVSSPAESIKLSEVPQVGKGKAGGSVVVSGSDDRSILLNEDKMLQRQPELLFHTATGIDLQQQQNLTSISQEIQESSISQPISKSFENIGIAKRNRDNTDEGKDSNMLEDLVKSEYQMAHQKGQLFSDNQSAKRAKSQEE